jgi:acyl-coenzyme A synthetase/AMP-(fatty) acid ligase
MSRVNFSRDVVDATPAGGRAIVEIARDGRRREWTFGEVADASARLAGAFTARGVRRGDVVLTLIGNRPEWVLAMVACFRIGAVAMPCNEQLRAGDLRARLDAAQPRLVIADERNTGELSSAGVACEVMLVPDPTFLTGPPAEPGDLSGSDPCLITFTSGTTGEATGIVHGQRYLPGRACRRGNGSTRDPGISSGARRRADGQSPRATSSSLRGCAALRRCCTTPASILTSGWRSWPVSASTCCAWHRRSIA